MEIKPREENLQSDYPVSSFDPCGNYPNQPYHQVVYSCSMYPIEPYQQLFPFQGGGINSTFRANRYYQIEIIEGSDYAYMERTAYQDSFGVFHPREYLGSYLTAIRGEELSGTGEYGIYGNGTFIRENSSLYFIDFDNYDQIEVNVTVKITDLDSNITTYWYTKVVNPELLIVNQQSENDTLLHYYSKDVSIKTSNIKFPCEHPGNGGCPPENVTFKIEIIEGAEYGTIKNSETGEVNSVFEGLSWEEIKTNIFTYYSNGLQPDSTARVTIRHSSSDADIQPQDISFIIKRNSIPPPSVGGSIYFQMDKKYVMPSDTVNIHLLWINEVSDTLEFLPMQRFRVEIAEGIEYGRLVDVGSGIQGDDLNDAGVDLKLIIETEIPVDLAKITLVAQADVLRFNRVIRGTGELQQEEAVERNINNKKEPITPEFIIVGDHIVGIAEVIIDKNPFVVEITPEEISAGDTALITIKQQNSDGSLIEFPANQQFEIGMIDGCLLGKLSKNGIDTNYFYGVTQPFYFIADTSADSGSVNIRVGVIDMNPQNRSLTNNNSPENDNPVSCANVNFVENLYANGEVVLENECDFDNCGDSYDDIQIELLTQPNGFQHAIYQLISEDGSVKGAVVDVDTTTVCDLDSANIKNGVVGQSTPVPYSRLRKNTSNNWEKSWILSPCKNDIGAIEYRTITKDSIRTSIYLDFVADVCYDLIVADSSNLTLVNDTTSLKDTSIVKDATIALHDICGHRCYPQIISKDGYIFKEIVYLHELQHRNHYKDIIDSLKQKYLIDKFKRDFTNDCKTFSQTIKNAESDSSSFESKIKQFVQEVTIEYHKQSGLEYKINGQVIVQGDPIKELYHERHDIHYVPVIENLVLDYLEALHYARGTPLQVTTCLTCDQ